MEIKNVLEICNKRNRSLVTEEQLEEFVENNIKKSVSVGELYAITATYEMYIYSSNDFEISKFIIKELISYLYLMDVSISSFIEKKEEELIAIYDELYSSGLFDVIENKNKKYYNLISKYLKEYENTLIIKTMLNFEVPEVNNETIDKLFDKDRMKSFAEMIRFLHPEQLSDSKMLSEILEEGLYNGKLNSNTLSKIIDFQK